MSERFCAVLPRDKAIGDRLRLERESDERARELSGVEDLAPHLENLEAANSTLNEQVFALLSECERLRSLLIRGPVEDKLTER